LRQQVFVDIIKVLNKGEARVPGFF
jgi:hypothetical protein